MGGCRKIEHLTSDASAPVRFELGGRSRRHQLLEQRPEWIKVDGILKALAKGHKGSPLTSFLLEPLFKGKSVNTPAFIMAALTQEKLLRVLKGKKRGHEFLDPEGFTARMDRLVNAPVKSKGTSRTSTKASTKKATVKRTTTNTPRKTATGTTKKAAIKKKAMSRRKTSKAT